MAQRADVGNWRAAAGDAARRHVRDGCHRARCGTAYVSAWMARRGAAVVGIDNSEAQLATARRLADEHGIELPDPRQRRIRSVSRRLIRLRNLGVRRAIWCDPYIWIPRRTACCDPAARWPSSVRRPWRCCARRGWLLADHRTARRDYFSIHRLDWRDAVDEPGGIEFNLPTSKWFRLFDDTGFDVVDFIEIQAPPPTKPTKFASSSLPSGPTATRPNRSGCSASGDRRASIVRGTTG